MSLGGALPGVRRALSMIALSCLCFALNSITSAQNSCQKDEIFGGYSWIAPNGWGDLDYKINNIPNAFDASNTYYLPHAHNLGLLLDGSGHFHGSTTPPNLQNGSNDSTGVGYALGGLQYKYHTSSLSPFIRGFVGAASLSPDCCHGNEWSLAYGGGGGLDVSVRPRFSIRLAQADYIRSSYSHVFPSTHPTEWNSVRLAAGIVFNLGNYCTETPVSCSASVVPSEVLAGEPVKFTATGANFNPKHTPAYVWIASGGKISSTTTQTTEIDTTGLAPGSYSASVTLSDPKMKNMNPATCAATFIVKQPPPPLPPIVSCTVNPMTIAVGEPATVTMTASSPEHRPLTFRWSTTGGQLTQQGGDSSTVTATAADAGKTITVTGTAVDDRSLTASCDVRVTVSQVPPCVNIEDWGQCTFEKNPEKPTRVDNDCKDVLDKLALRLQQSPSGKLDIVGYTDEGEGASEKTLAAQRSVNVKYYMTQDSLGPKADATRIESRQGGVQGKLAIARFYYIPEGKLCSDQTEQGSAVDENAVKGQSRKTTSEKPVKKIKSSPPAQ